MEPTRNVVLIGGSQGALAAMKILLRGLPSDLRVAIGVTIHRSPTFRSSLAELLGKHSSLPVFEPRHGELFRPGNVYLAPPDHHMVFRGGAVWLDRGPKQHHVRPAVDPMFISGSKAYGARVIGILLTGNLSDGVSGLVAIKKGGGLSLAQDPKEAEAPSMPIHAIAYDDVDAIFQLAAASTMIRDLARGVELSTLVEAPPGEKVHVNRAPPADPDSRREWELVQALRRNGSTH